MKVERQSMQKRREFLSRTGIVALGALPMALGITPRSVLAGGCGVTSLGRKPKEAGPNEVVAMGILGGLVASLPGAQNKLIGLVIVGGAVAHHYRDRVKFLDSAFESIEEGFKKLTN